MEKVIKFLSQWIEPEALLDIALDEIFARVPNKAPVIAIIRKWLKKIDAEVAERE